jgi:hypothetical protein
MVRFFFDVRENDRTIPDLEGVILPDMETVQREAAQSLVEIARDIIRTYGRNGPLELAIEVRTDDGPILQAKLVFEMVRIGLAPSTAAPP